MDLTGKIIKIFDVRGGTSAKTGNAWQSQSYVLETNEQYPKHLVFDVFGEDKITQFNIKEGQDYTVYFDIDAHEYEGRWFTDIRAWKVTPPQQPAPSAPQQQDPFAAQPNDYDPIFP